MSCNGIDRELLRLMVEDLLQKAIADGKIQGGLLDCGGTALAAKRKVYECAAAQLDKEEAKAALDAAKAAAEAADAELKAAMAADKAQADNKDVLTNKRIDGLAADVDEAKALAADTLAKAKEYADLTEVKLTAVNVRGRVLSAVLTDGTELTAQLPDDVHLTNGVIADGKLVLTQSNGERVEVDLRDWRGTQPCEYYPTMMVTIRADDCGMMSRVGFVYHPEDVRDPAADVRWTDCDDNTVAWLYPTGGNGRIEVRDDKNNSIGFVSAAPVVRVWDCANQLTS